MMDTVLLGSWSFRDLQFKGTHSYVVQCFSNSSGIRIITAGVLVKIQSPRSRSQSPRVEVLDEVGNLQLNSAPGDPGTTGKRPTLGELSWPPGDTV